MYIHTEKIHNTKSAEVVVPILIDLFHPKSVLDVGCGTGTWLKVFRDYGIEEIYGLDGDYVDLRSLFVAPQFFKALDLRNEFQLNKAFDITICLEVAEHLPESSAGNLVRSLVNHSDIIIFSAAIPGQGGQNHLNEQWPRYWQSLFKKYSYSFLDLIRPLIWDSSDVFWWYRQNLYVVVKDSIKCRFINEIPLLSVKHHLPLEKEIRRLACEHKKILAGGMGVRSSFKILYRAIKRRIIR